MTSEIRANTLKNRVGLGTVSFTNTGPVVSGIVTANGLELNSVDAGSSAGPELKLFRNSASPANADYLGQLKFAGESSTGVERNYAKITGKILDVTNGSEDGILEFAHIKGGSQTITGRWRSDSLQLLNGTSLTVAGSTTVTGNIIPSSDSATDIGTNSVRFANVYTDNLDVSGNLFVVDSILHTGDTNTKIRFSGSDTISLQTAGSERLLIKSTGYVGINTTGLYPLDVLEPTNNAGLISITGANTSYDTGFLIRNGSSPKWYLINDVNGAGGHSFEIRGDGWSNDRFLTLTQTGKLGVNNTNPNAYDQFVVSGTGNIIAASSTSGYAGIGLYEGATGRFFLRTLNGSNGLAFYRDNTNEALRITSDGKIGINESSPGQRLTVGGDIQIGFNTPNDAGRQLNFNVNRGSAGQTLANINWQWNSKFVAQIRGIAGSDTTNKDDAHLAFFTSSANNLGEKLRITSGGSVNIGGDYTQTAKKFKVTGNSTFDGGIHFTGTLESSGFSVSGGNVIMPAFIAHDADPNTKFGFAAADRFTVETAGNERLRIDENGKIIVATGTLHSTRVLARFGIDCHGMNIFDNVGVVANYGMAFYNDPSTNYANGIGFFNDDGQTCGGYIVHQDKGGGNVGDIIMATSATSNTPVERLTISSLGNIKQNLSSPSGTSPYQNTHWYDRDGGKYTLTAIDDNYLSATKNDSSNDYNDIIYKRVRMSKNCDIEFELSGNSPAGIYRHVGFVINGDGTATHANWDRLVFRSRPANTSNNQIRIDKGGGGYGFNVESSSIPTFFDGTERHILIQLRDRLVNVIVDGEVIISQKTNADFNRSQGWFGFGIYEGGESAQVYIRNLTIKNKFIQPHWLVRATGVNVDVSNGSALPFNQVIKSSSDINNTSHYNNSAYRFNVPISGMYYCFVRAYRNSSTGSEVAFYVNGSVRNRFKPVPNGGDYIFAGSCLIQLMKGEYIDVRAYSGTFGNFYGNSSQSFSSWGGHLID